MTQVISNVIFRAWGVASPKGNAVFLDHTRAMEYAGKMHGILVDLSTTYNVQETSYNSLDIRQEGQVVVERCELISTNSSSTEVFCGEGGDASTGILTCGNCGAIETAASAAGCKNNNCPL